MAKHTVTLIPGDGIGLETTAAMRRVVEAAGADIEWEVAEAGAHMMDVCGTPLPEETIEAVRKNKVAIKGPITTPVGTGFRSVNVALRKTLELNLRKVARMLPILLNSAKKKMQEQFVLIRAFQSSLFRLLLLRKS